MVEDDDVREEALTRLKKKRDLKTHVFMYVAVNATLIVYFLPYLYMFAAAIKLRLDVVRQEGAVPVPGGAAGSWFWNGLGFITTAVAIVLALIPPADAADRGAFFLQVAAGSFGFVVAGLVLYALAERRRRRAESAGAA